MSTQAPNTCWTPFDSFNVVDPEYAQDMRQALTDDYFSVPSAFVNAENQNPQLIDGGKGTRIGVKVTVNNEPRFLPLVNTPISTLRYPTVTQKVKINRDNTFQVDFGRMIRSIPDTPVERIQRLSLIVAHYSTLLNHLMDAQIRQEEPSQEVNNQAMRAIMGHAFSVDYFTDIDHDGAKRVRVICFEFFVLIDLLVCLSLYCNFLFSLMIFFVITLSCIVLCFLLTKTLFLHLYDKKLSPRIQQQSIDTHLHYLMLQKILKVLEDVSYKQSCPLHSEFFSSLPFKTKKKILNSMPGFAGLKIRPCRPSPLSKPLDTTKRIVNNPAVATEKNSKNPVDTTEKTVTILKSGPIRTCHFA